MTTPPGDGASYSSDSPDVPFSLGGGPLIPGAPGALPEARTPVTPPSVDVVDQLVQQLLAVAPAGWTSMAATFAITMGRQTGMVVFGTDRGQIEVGASSETLRLARLQREASVGVGNGPWWRMMVAILPGGVREVVYDDGAEPVAPEFMFEPADYRADIEAFPDRVPPVWLAAYAYHGGRQRRTPQQAVNSALTEYGSRRVLAEVDDQWPELPTLWARWAALAGVFASMRAPFGPTIAPGIAIFESSGHSGSTLARLPGDRAVLSGGVFDSPELSAAYLGGGDLPDLYVGAPVWVTDATLNVRAETGLLSLCWWYERGHWHRGGSPDAQASVSALPAIGSTRETAQAIVDALPRESSDDLLAIAEAYVGAVEARTLTSVLVEALLPREAGFDGDAALVALAVAGCFDT